MATPPARTPIKEERKTHTFSWEELAPRIAEAATQTFGVPATVTVVDAPEPAPLTIKSLFRRISQ
jgi:hypothetical protein